MENRNWSKAERKEYISKITKWKSELVRYYKYNVYIHPDNLNKPYWRKVDNGVIRMVPYKVNSDMGGSEFSTKYDNQTHIISIDQIEHYMDTIKSPNNIIQYKKREVNGSKFTNPSKFEIRRYSIRDRNVEASS